MSSKLTQYILREEERKALAYINRKLAIGSSSSGGTYPMVDTFTALPDSTTVEGKVYLVLNSIGTKYWTNLLGGSDYYAKGFYYSTGPAWEYLADIPYQATQAQVN